MIQEAYVQGISTRWVDELVKALGMTGISKSQVSRLCEEIDGKVKAFLDRPLEGDWPYLWIDATYVKVRQPGRIVSVAVIIAVGVNGDGRHEVLGMDIGASEAETFWPTFLRKLTRRGLRGVKLVISDGHEASRRPSSRCLTPPGSGAACTSCAMPWRTPARAAGASFPPSSPPPSPRTTPRPPAPSGEGSLISCAPSCPSSRPFDAAETDVLAFMSFPKDYRPKIHSTNPLERPIGEIKRRTEVPRAGLCPPEGRLGIFPNEDAITRSVGALLIEQNDEGRCSGPST